VRACVYMCAMCKITACVRAHVSVCQCTCVRCTYVHAYAPRVRAQSHWVWHEVTADNLNVLYSNEHVGEDVSMRHGCQLHRETIVDLRLNVSRNRSQLVIPNANVYSSETTGNKRHRHACLSDAVTWLQL